MSYRNIIDKHCSDLNNLGDLLFKYSNAYKLLVSGACEINGVALARKKDVRDAIKRAAALGMVIDDLIETIDYCDCTYFKYCRLKADYINCKMTLELIQAEVDNELCPVNILEKKP